MSHAPHAPSSSERWTQCHASVELCAAEPDKSSKFAREGTYAHDIAARCLKNGKSAMSFIGRKSPETKEGPAGEFTVDAEMARYVDDYVDFVNAMQLMWGGEALIEQPVSINVKIYGTADVILLSEDGTTLHVIDFKYGAGKIVNVQGNTQALCYAIGAIKKMGPVRLGLLESVVLHIYQPRAGGEPWRECEVTMAGIESAEQMLKQHSDLIAAGSKKFKTGPHCQFCKVSAKCPARADDAQVAAQEVFAGTPPPAVETLSAERLGGILALAPRVKEWLVHVEKFAQQKLERGESVPGFKLVAGQKGDRKWTDPKEAAEMLGLVGINGYTDPAVVSPAQAEKLLAKQRVKMDLNLLVERKEGNPKMVHESDPRPAADARVTFKKS